MTKAIRTYADTSVFGGILDDEFEKASSMFLEQVKQGKFELVVSPVVTNELRQAPEAVRDVYRGIVPLAQFIDISQEALDLQSAYLDANVVTPRWELDALHVAMATVAGCSVIVSWNFKHIVNFRRIPLYNGVNIAQGYQPISIHSPMEVIYDEE